MRVTLTWQARDGATRSLDVPGEDGHTLAIGRSMTADVNVEHPTISRQHAQIVVRHGRCWLRDLDSTYGTRVNGTRINGETQVGPDDIVMLGGVRLGLVYTAVPSSDALEDEGHDIDFSTTVLRPVVTPGSSGRIDTGSTQAGRLLKLLSEITRSLVQPRDIGEVLTGVVDLVFDAVAAERAFLLLRDSPFDPLTTRVARGADGQPLRDTRLSRTVVNTVIRDRVAMLADDALVDRRLDLAHSVQALSIRSFLCAPLWNQNDVIGVLYADTPRSRRFSEDDLTVFVALANYAAVAIEHARLTERVTEESRRRERLQRYHSPRVVDRILGATSDAAAFDTQIRDVTVMFIDLVGFTTL